MNLAMDVEDEETRRMPPMPYLPHELIVSEILVRLPVKLLLRFRCVCKAWRDTISEDTSFSEAYLRRVHGQNMKPSSLLIAPYITVVDYDRYSVLEYVTPGLYLWEENPRRHGVATLVHNMAWFPAADRMETRHGFAHCDGLIMLPDTKGTVRVLNPATQRSLTLPWSPNNIDNSTWGFRCQNEFGFGRNPSSGAYKVARFFCRDPPTLYSVICSLGMEVFTVGEDRCWRKTAVEPPYPFIERRAATFFKGSLIWTVDLDKSIMYHDINDADDEPCFLRFSLEDESFRVMAAPPWYTKANYKEFKLAELHGELALARLNEESVEIWMWDDVDAVNPPLWARHHVLNCPSCIHPIASFDDGLVFRDMSNNLWRKTSEGFKRMARMSSLMYRNPDTDTLRKYSSSTFHDFDVIPYIPTLVPI